MSKSSGQKDPSMDEILGSIRRIITEDNAQSGGQDAPADGAPSAEDDDILDLTDVVGTAETRREPILKRVEPQADDEGAVTPMERREPVLGIHSPANAAQDAVTQEAAASAVPAEGPATEAAAPDEPAQTVEPVAAGELPSGSETVTQGEEPAMATSDDSATPPAGQPEAAADIVSETTTSATSAALGELSRAVEEKAGRLRLGQGDATVSDIVKELLRPMLREWIDENLPAIVERVVRREIQKLVDRAPDGD